MLVNTQGQTPVQKTSKHMSTPERRKSADKGDTGHFQQVTVIRHFKYSVLGIYSWQGRFELHYITNISFFKVRAEPNELRGLLIKQGGAADSRLLAGVHGRPNYDLCAERSGAPLWLPVLSPLGWHRPGLRFRTLLNTGRWANTFRAKVDMASVVYLWEKIQPCSFQLV